MKRFVAGFALLGFAAALVVGLTGDAEITSVINSAMLWGITFAVLGYFLGRTAGVLLSEAGISDVEAAAEGPPGAEPGGEAVGEQDSNQEFLSGSAPEQPITDDEASAAPGSSAPDVPGERGR